MASGCLDNLRFSTNFIELICEVDVKKLFPKTAISLYILYTVTKHFLKSTFQSPLNGWTTTAFIFIWKRFLVTRKTDGCMNGHGVVSTREGS